MSHTTLPRIRFAHLPTPIEALPHLSASLKGPKLWIKRDDQTGLALGGNKTRKLEFLLAEAQSQGAKTLITRGALQSNHCRQTAAAAARQGYACILVLGSPPPERPTANVLLDRLLGAEIVWAGDRDPSVVIQQTFDQATEEGRRPFLIPYGGSTPTGAVAYVEAISEFMAQNVPVDHMVVATSSGGTQAGMLVGMAKHGFKGQLLGISVDKSTSVMQETIATLANQTAALLQQPQGFQPQDVLVNDDYCGAGYAVMGEVERQAINLFARQEGILLDPVYTGRAAGGLIDLIRKGHFGKEERVLFWHTGGTPSLFAYGDSLF
ncbi:MAG: D-cysteine desulfhydrase family protein [Anaerolineales bacterium]|jgi:D-cysteine desulfhydrase family pyridoxal phosphate-dependent enzyme